MKVILEYDPTTSNVTTSNGEFIGSWIGLQDHEYVPQEQEDGGDKGDKSGVVAKLYREGMSADDIVKLKNAGLI